MLCICWIPNWTSPLWNWMPSSETGMFSSPMWHRACLGHPVTELGHSILEVSKINCLTPRLRLTPTVRCHIGDKYIPVPELGVQFQNYAGADWGPTYLTGLIKCRSNYQGKPLGERVSKLHRAAKEWKQMEANNESFETNSTVSSFLKTVVTSCKVL